MHRFGGQRWGDCERHEMILKITGLITFYGRRKLEFMKATPVPSSRSCGAKADDAGATVLRVPLARFTPRVGGGSAFFVRPLGTHL